MRDKNGKTNPRQGETLARGAGKRWAWRLIFLCVLLGTLAIFGGFMASLAEENEPSLGVKAKNLSFEDSLNLIYAVDASNVKTTSNVRLLIFSDSGNMTKGNETVLLKPSGKATVGGVSCLIFEYTGTSAKKMTDTLYARAYVVQDGKEYYGASDKYSVLRYLYNKLGYSAGSTASTNQDYIDLLTDLLHYGARAQKYFGYATDRPADGKFVDVTVEGGTLSDGFSTGLYFAGTTISVTAPEEKDGATFAAWKDGNGNTLSWQANADISLGEENVTLRAVYQKYYTVTFVDINGDPIRVQTVMEGEDATPPTPPDVTDKVFTGWSGSYTNVTSDRTVTATYQTAYQTSPAEGYITLLDRKALYQSGSGKNQVTLQSVSASGSTPAYVKYTASGNDPYLYYWANLSQTMNVGGKMVMLYRTSNCTSGGIFLGQSNVTENGAQNFNYTKDGNWHLLVLDLTQNPEFGDGNVHYFRLDHSQSSTSGHRLDVAYIAFYPPTEEEPVTFTANGITENGISYDVEDYAAKSGSRVTVSASEPTVYWFDNAFPSAFSAYTLEYSSDACLQGAITYGKSGGSYTEEFFLEAGERLTFTSLVDNFLDGVVGAKVKKIELTAIEDKNTVFTLHKISTEKRSVPSSTTFTLEGTRYILGADLLWGGGISYIEDKQDGDSGLSNLINRCDTGRLVQQSYYGTGSNGEYTAATYSGTTWSYNPVQGGDQYGNHSKIVDYSISADGRSMFVKCRPGDWAQNGMLCPAYMENVYTLYGDRIQVDNRFIDFSGWVHPYSHQELPAFYPVSYFCDFVYYNGTSPWTGDTLTTVKKPPFWAGNSDAYHHLKVGNTETFCAFVSQTGYGVGLYVPEVDCLLAGRNLSSTVTKDSASNATSYVAPLVQRQMQSFEAFEYSYLITTGDIDDIYSVFEANRDFADNSDLHEHAVSMRVN